MELQKIQKLFSIKRILWIILLGLAVVIFLFIRGFDKEAFLAIRWSWYATMWIFLALCCMLVRDFAYMYRIRHLTEKKLTWKRCFEIIMMWEFASAATHIGGGSAFAFFLLVKEKIGAGRSTAIVIFTLILDEMFFIIAAPLFFILAGQDLIFPHYGKIPSEVEITGERGVSGLVYLFVLGYVIQLVYTLILGYGLFVNPRGLKWLLHKIFSIKFLKRWREKATQVGTDVIITSKELQNKSLKFYLQAIVSTIAAWTGRYLVINCLIMAFAPVDNHFIIYARQVVMWVIMLVAPTPGSSGVAELVFTSFLSEYIPKGLDASLALLWRLISYYPYLFIGVIVLPRWIKRVFADENGLKT